MPDLVFVIGPAFVVTGVVLLLPGLWGAGVEVSPVLWLVLVAGIDVSHVYSTLWRTYFDRTERKKYQVHLWVIPVLAWICGMVLYGMDGLLFWRVLAYLAVFHFVRQQYGFMSLYARKDGRAGWERQLDAGAVYLATLYPLVYWHTHLPRPFHWFIEGDFVALDWPWLSVVVGVVYVGVLVGYVVKEIWMGLKGRRLNLPKNLILLGTVVSWYVGIVWLEGDIAFTATNVIAHGIPYMALVWMYGRKKHAGTGQGSVLKAVFRWEWLPVFVGVLLVLAYVEEGLWDALVWREHVGLFPWASGLPVARSEWVLAVVVPLLAVPQVTHYVLDGFIWKLRRGDGDLRVVE